MKWHIFLRMTIFVFMNSTATYWIQKLNLQKHPEGGYFSETYRSGEKIQQVCLPHRFKGNRSFSTAIYFLLEGSSFSALHRIHSDELWHFYTGSPLSIYVIDANSKLRTITLGSDPEKGEVFQAVVKAGAWFGAKGNNVTGFSLVGCTVAPGFDFNDFEMGQRDELIQRYPEHRQIIHTLCRT